MKQSKTIATILILSAALAACGQQNYPQVPQQQIENPMQQAPVPQAQDGFDGGDAALGAVAGAAAGYMLGKGSSQPQRTVIIDNRRPDYGYNNGYRSGYGYNKGYGGKQVKTTTTTTVKKSMFGGKTTTTTRTTTKRRR